MKSAAVGLLLLLLAGAAGHASAAFHLYRIDEVYSNADGSIQFIELSVGDFDGESFWQGLPISVSQGGVTHSFTFPSNLPGSSTANTSVLIATQGFADLGIVAPNFMIPAGFLFTSGGTLNFANVDIVTYGPLPARGILSMNRDGSTGTNSPTNFAGITGTVPALNVSVGKAGTGGGTVTSDLPGIDCGPTCAASFGQGSTVTLSAAPGAGSLFAGWSGDCSGTGACVVSLSVARSVLATFNVVALDSQTPSVPAPFTATAQGVSQIDLVWGASSDDVAVTQYKIFRGGTLLASLPAASLAYSDTGLAASTTYIYAMQACDAAGNCSAQSASASATTQSPPDTTAPSVPSGLTAGAVSSSQIDLSWSAATDNAGVTAYKVYRGGVLIRTLGNITSYSNSGLAASTTYSYAVAACDAAGNCSAPSAAATATTAAAAADSTVFSPQILAKWNLLGNTGTLALDVATFFGTQDAPVSGVSPYVLSVWKWVVNPSTGAGNWAFFTPSLTSAESDAAALAQGYDALSTINPGEGFWVNRTNPPGLTTPVTLNGPASAPFYHDAMSFDALKKNAWHLIATDSPVEPGVFNNADVNPLPPSPEVVPTNLFQTLWAWSAAAQQWYFYATAIEANGYTSATGTVYTGLDAVRQAAVDAGYLDFDTATPAPKTLGSGVGFWVRR